VAADKKQVPLEVFKRLLAAALNPPQSSLEVPFTEDQPHKATPGPLFICARWWRRKCLPRPTPRVWRRGFLLQRVGLYARFRRSVFGNAGRPVHPRCRAGCGVIGRGTPVASSWPPHLVNLTKKELGLPHISQASERQKRDRMCYTDDAEKYNDGGAFKISSRG
jgi:hypothetical protein